MCAMPTSTAAIWWAPAGRRAESSGPESFADIALKAVRNGLSHEAFLHELVRLECEAREQRRRARLLLESGLPREKSFRTLQLGVFAPLIRQQIERLRSGTFVQQAINVVVVGIESYLTLPSTLFNVEMLILTPVFSKISSLSFSKSALLQVSLSPQPSRVSICFLKIAKYSFSC